MSTQTKQASHYSADMVARATERAATDDVYKALVRKADHAGKVAGAAVHGKDAGEFWKELADDIARCAVVTFPPSEGAKAKPDEKAVMAARVELRDLCALVNVGIKQAQSYAKRLAVQEFKAAQMADRAKKARDRIVKTVSRALEVYGVKVNLQAGKAEPCAKKVPTEKTDAQKAASAVQAGTGADFDAFVAELCKLDPEQQKVIIDRVGAAYAKWQEGAATAKTEADAAKGAEIKQEHNDNKARAELRQAS